MADDYNIQRKLDKEALDYHHSKLQDKPFSNVARKKDHFFSNK